MICKLVMEYHTRNLDLEIIHPLASNLNSARDLFENGACKVEVVSDKRRKYTGFLVRLSSERLEHKLGDFFERAGMPSFVRKGCYRELQEILESYNPGTRLETRNDVRQDGYYVVNDH